MATRPGIKIRYRPTRNYSVFQGNYPGAQTETGKRGWWPQVGEPTGGVSPATDAVLKFGGRLFIVGDFTTVAGQARAGFAALEISTGALVATGWQFHANGTNPQSLATDGTYLYVGGDFDEVNDEQGSGNVSTIDGQPVNGLVRLDYNGNLDLTWNPAPNLNPDIDRMTYNPDRASLYVAGNGLTSIGGQARAFVAEILVSDGTATTWDPDPDSTVTTIVVDTDRDLVYLGGDFTTLDGGGTARDRLARTDYTGSADAWDPGADATVQDLLLDGLRVYAVGNFANIGATPVARGKGALLDDEGEALEWDPDANTIIKRVAKLGNLIFLAGEFTTVLGTARNGLAAMHAAEDWLAVAADDLDDWDPDPDANDVRDMALVRKTFYCAGSFTTSTYAPGQGQLQAIPWPILTDANTKYVAKTGSDSGGGTAADPFLTINFALGAIGGAIRYVGIQDSETYDERLEYNYSGVLPAGIFALDGQAPVLSYSRGATAGTYGARRTGRTKFSTGAGTTFYYVSKDGDDGSGARGNPSKPFKTISGALADGARVANDTVQIEDDGVYDEDLDHGALAVTIQARDGKVPTLRNGAGATHFDADSAALDLYGLNIADSIKTTGQTILAQKNISCYDCTFSRNAIGIYAKTGATGTLTLTVVNCAFYRTGQMAIFDDYKTANLTVTNCYFEGCNVDVSRTATPASFGAVVGFKSDDAGEALTWKVSRCTFNNNYSAAFAMVNQGAGTGTANGSAKFLSCVVTFDEAPVRQSAGVSFGMTGATAFSYEVDNCYFFQCSGPAVLDAQSNLKAAGTGKIANCVARRCCMDWTSALPGLAANRPAGSFVPAINFVSATFQQAPRFTGVSVYPKGPNQAYMKNCVALESGGNGFAIQLASATGTPTLENCVTIGSAFVGFNVKIPSGKTLTAKNCLEVGSKTHTGFKFTGVPDLGTGTCSWEACVAGEGFNGGLTTKGSLISNPIVISSLPLEENVGLRAESLAINASLTAGNAGIQRALLTITATTDPFWVDGLIFRGDVNFDNGIEVYPGMDSWAMISQCSFEGLAVEALRLGSGSIAENCLLEPNGMGIMLADAADQARRCVILGAPSAAVYTGESAARVEHLTAYGCEYGTFEAATAIGQDYDANVLAGSGVLDYSGAATQAHSDVPTISDDATVEDGSRANPLLRNLDPGAEDLRLQAIAAGFYFDSPAKALAADGSDAGAYDFYYGALAETWTTLDLDDPGFTNPFNVERTSTPIKPREGTFVSGDTYSGAQAVKREYVFSWPDDAAMSTAQLNAWVDLYEYGEGEAQIDFGEGDGWVPVRRIQSDSGIARTETARLPYANDDVDLVIRSMTFRESA